MHYREMQCKDCLATVGWKYEDVVLSEEGDSKLRRRLCNLTYKGRYVDLLPLHSRDHNLSLSLSHDRIIPWKGQILGEIE